MELKYSEEDLRDAKIALLADLRFKSLHCGEFADLTAIIDGMAYEIGGK